jgi:hypothetical protein
VLPQFGGEPYRTAISNYVDVLNQKGLIPILELHWSAPGSKPATGQSPMPDLDHTPDFWRSVAQTFNDNSTGWHVYNFSVCSSRSCFEQTAAPVAAVMPLIAGEIGENDCAHGFIDDLMDFLDENGAGYLGWAWNAGFDCAKGPALISNYDGTPTAFGVGLMEHRAERKRLSAQ